MDQYFRYEAVRQRLRVGPLSEHLDTFAQKLSDFGYAKDTGQDQLRVVAWLSRWMLSRKLLAKDLNEQVMQRFLQQRQRQRGMRGTDPNTLALLLEHLRQEAPASRPQLAPRTVWPLYNAISHAISSMNAAWPTRPSATTWGFLARSFQRTSRRGWLIRTS